MNSVTRYVVNGTVFSSRTEAESAAPSGDFIELRYDIVWDVVTEAGTQVVVGVSEETAKAEQERLKNDIDGDPSVVFTLATREVPVD